MILDPGAELAGWFQSLGFDHILAVIPQFGLKVFQRPSGRDLSDTTRYLGDRLKTGNEGPEAG